LTLTERAASERISDTLRCLLNLLLRASCSDSTKKCRSTTCSSDDPSPTHDDDYYDVISDEQTNDTSTNDITSSRMSGRSLPPLPSTGTSQDGYTRLNYVPDTENVAKVDNYYVVTDVEDNRQNDAANDGGFLNPFCTASTENIDEADDAKTAVVVVTPQLETFHDGSLDTSGYLKLYHVPSTEDVSKVDDVVNYNDAEKIAANQLDVGYDSGLDGNGDVMLRDVTSSENTHKVGEIDVTTSCWAEPRDVTTSCRAESRDEDSVVKNDCHDATATDVDSSV